MSGKIAHAIEKGILNTSNVLMVISAGLLLVLMLIGTSDVLGRYLFNKPIRGTYEWSQILLAGICFFGWGAVQVAREHVRVDLAFRRFSPRLQAILNFTNHFLILVLIVFIGWRGLLMAKQNQDLGRLVYTIELPQAWFQLLVPLGALMVSLVLIVQLVYYVKQMRGKE